MMKTMVASEMYKHFLESPSKEKWERIGTRKRSGVCTPLFSLYSGRSIGAGEIPDLKLLVDWCRLTSMSIIQLLPLNDVGYDFRPYDAQSTFALDPMYLSLRHLRNLPARGFKMRIERLRKRFPPKGRLVDYGFKREKMKLLLEVYEASRDKLPEDFENYRKREAFWLEDYALFKVIKEKVSEESWEDWPAPYKHRDDDLMTELREKYPDSLRFHVWLQWQLFLQFSDVKAYARQNGVFLMGDLPFLVSRDSSDVWFHQDYFKLDRVSGAPPDAYIADGQRWGMPPYRWENIAEHGYDYLTEKLRYASCFYDMFRIDHVVGVFRLWTIDVEEPVGNGGRNGVFDPADEAVWEEHGRNLLAIMMRSTLMLPCAEDLGTVPDCSYRVLEDYAIPGMDVQRWQRDWDHGADYLDPGRYRKHSISVISTHDMPILLAWWAFEVFSADLQEIRSLCEESRLDFEAVRTNLFKEGVYNGRLVWKDEIQTEAGLAGRLAEMGAVPEGFKRVFHVSVDERNKAAAFLGISHPETASYRDVVRGALLRAGEADSIFSVQLIQDWLSLGDGFDEDPWGARINFPGTVSDRNWSLRMPVSLEQMYDMPENKKVRRLNEACGRI